MATDSCGRWNNDADACRSGFAVLESLRKGAQCKSFGLGHCLVGRRTVGERAGQLHHLGQPTAVVFAFDVKSELHGCLPVASHSVRGGLSRLLRVTSNVAGNLPAKGGEADCSGSGCSIAAKRQFLRENLDALIASVDTVAAALGAGNKLLLFGNGGSAAD